MSPAPRGSRKPEEDYAITKEEVSALLWAAREALEDYRLYYLIFLQYLLGMRISEALLLEWKHLGPLNARGEPEWVEVPTLKKKTTDGIPPLMRVPVLSHPVLVRQAFDPRRRSKAEMDANSPWLFMGMRAGVPLSFSQAQRLFRTTVAAAGLRPTVTSHSLRHTANSLIYSASYDTTICARFLRHSVTHVTERYIHIGKADWAKLRGVLDLPPIQPLPDSKRASAFSVPW